MIGVPANLLPQKLEIYRIAVAPWDQPVFMEFTSEQRSMGYCVVIVDAQRFVSIWRDLASREPEIWKKDHKLTTGLDRKSVV